MGWDDLVCQAASIEGWGGGTSTALLGYFDLCLLCLLYSPFSSLIICNV
jgi:hypothetical protein